MKTEQELIADWMERAKLNGINSENFGAELEIYKRELQRNPGVPHSKWW